MGVEGRIAPRPLGGGLWELGAASPRNGLVRWEPCGDGISTASLSIATSSEDER